MENTLTLYVRYLAKPGCRETFLRQLTQGRGYFTFEFVRYETLPQMLENKVIEQAKALGNFADED